MSRAAMNNRSNQMNPNNSAYWSSRGLPGPGGGGGGGDGSGGAFGGGGLFVGDQVTIRFVDGLWTPLYAPLFTVSVAIIGDVEDAQPDSLGRVRLAKDRPLTVVYARRAPDEGSAAVEFARKRYPSLNWVRTSGAHCGTGGGTTPRYWIVRLRQEDGGGLHLDDLGGRDSLDGLVPGLVSAEAPVAPCGRATPPAPHCPDCKEPMVEGFVPNSTLNTLPETHWHEGLAADRPYYPIGNDRYADDFKSLPVRTYRCSNCGLLRDYAFSFKDWEAWAWKGWK